MTTIDIQSPTQCHVALMHRSESMQEYCVNYYNGLFVIVVLYFKLISG